MKPQISVVKIGGNIVSDTEKLEIFLSDFSKMEGHKVLVHGGGKMATKLAEKLEVASQMVNGRRITNSAMLDVVTMVYGGLTNKKLVAELQKNSCNAIGLSGADGNAIMAHKRIVKDIDYGFVGDIEKVNSNLLKSLIVSEITPVFCALTHDGDGQLLNTNADTIASEVAIALSHEYNVSLYYCFEKKGVLKDINDHNSVIRSIHKNNYPLLLKENIITDGMLPKLHNCFNALENGVTKVCLGDEKMITSQSDQFTTITL